jgi:hypothetical protein
MIRKSLLRYASLTRSVEEWDVSGVRLIDDCSAFFSVWINTHYLNLRYVTIHSFHKFESQNPQIGGE